jgi:hypothetical protein
VCVWMLCVGEKWSEGWKKKEKDAVRQGKKTKDDKTQMIRGKRIDSLGRAHKRVGNQIRQSGHLGWMGWRVNRTISTCV